MGRKNKRYRKEEPSQEETREPSVKAADSTTSGNILYLARSFWLRIRVPVISLFVAYHVAAIALWLSPPFPLRNELLALVRPYVAYFGFWQRWNVFAPDPKTWNSYLTADVHFADGTTKVWEFPRMEKLNLVDRMAQERFRKWTVDSVNDTNLEAIWPDTARYIARQYADPVNPPVSVSVIRHWSWISPPEGHRKKLPEGEGSHTLFTHYVSIEDVLQ